MDPITALGLAANIIQFIGIGYKVCSKGLELYNSNSGALTETEERRKLAQSLIENSKVIDTAARDDGEGPDSSTRLLCVTCQQLGNELLNVLKNLDVKVQKHRIWNSALKSVLALWKEEDIKKIEDRIAKVQTQLNHYLLTALNKHTSDIGLKLDKLIVYHEDLRIQNNLDITALRDSLLAAVEGATGNSRRPISQKMQFNEKLKVLTDQMLSNCIRMSKEQQILKSLHYKTRKRRQHNIAMAHPRTFKWIFDDVWPEDRCEHNFKSWLMKGSGHFWIAGKAGSGKSTLMKYIYEDPRTRESLMTWGKPLVMASHFFWNAGTTALEKSQEGLLRSILYDILRQRPDLIPSILAQRWAETMEDLNTTEQDWYRDELIQCFRDLVILDLSDIRFCFFIDGLDEYEGNHIEFSRFLKEITACPSIKLCISSRPWNAFTDAFGKNDMPHIILQDYNSGDIRVFITESLKLLETNSEYLKPDAANDDYTAIINEIVGKAQGVFLWVYLALKSLERGLINQDPVWKLLERIRAFPPDLEDYFQHMLNSVEETYQAQGALFMLMCMATIQSLPALAVNYIDLNNELIPLKSEVLIWSEKELLDILPVFRRRLHAHCGDLLEIVGSTNDSSFMFEVDFLHRTVRDYLSKTKLYDLLRSRAAALPRPQKALMMNTLAQMKIRPRETIFKGKAPLHASLIEIFMAAAGNEENEDNDSSPSNGKRGSSITAYLQEAERVRLSNKVNSPAILAWAIYHSMLSYTTYMVEQQPNLVSGIRSFLPLDVALNGLSNQGAWYDSTAPKMPNVPMVRYLLQKGASPNQKHNDGQTIWSRHLNLLSGLHNEISRLTEGDSNDWIRVIGLLLSHGADPDLELVTETKNTKIWTGERSHTISRSVANPSRWITIEEILTTAFHLEPEDHLLQHVAKCRSEAKMQSKGYLSSVWKYFSG